MDTQRSGTGRRPRGWAVRVGVPAVVGVVLLVVSGRVGAASPAAPVAPAPRHAVVLTVRALPAGLRIRRDDLRVVSTDLPGFLGVVDDPGTAVGMETSLALAAGSPLLRAALRPPVHGGETGSVEAITLDPGGVAPGIRAGDTVMVIAAADGPPVSRPVVYIVARVRVVDQPRPTAPGPGGGSATGSAPGGGTSAGVRLAVDCPDQATAMRLLWAQAFARSIEVVLAPDDPGAADLVVSGPGPGSG